ncbi:hypothetical protein G6F16_001788 [Rhizopus arrhizus]|nr:hypothetical protein G6F23_000505 [Rhizopus arrhizus]KAG0770430.1 hypothetical protein G6F24_000224 [Rhizopus arrhizus]KAG0794567.1 hypothetical protein G6F21_002763 [Rhizopus arrhizus]KAG0801608.1 hypothetical protein G6F22_001075 [Rhizopus arrhizus]KAG0815905.1 hypothetical protein G6F20_003618 [Rhizopus arrhizus]
MYSYPAEYLLHPVPVMAVYGLPTPDEPSLLDALDEQPQKNESSKMGLATNLLSLFTNKSEYTLYEATTYLSNQQVPPPFRVIPVSKDYMLPLRPPPIAPNLPPPHSNLSPLSADSPIYPDGIMTPLWIKKHLYYPSTVVGFYELWDWHTETRPKRETGPLASQILIDPTEREHDMSLATEINVRRKYFQEKGIKFAAVIMLKQKYADSSIEERLSSIKKQCGLDYKSSFFTIAPSSTNDLQEFVNNLYRVLYEPATQFYNNRIKKIRKKRSKLPSPSAVSKPLSDGSTTEQQPLSVSGWIFRYDLKTAFFQECKQEIDGALKSYEAAYHSLTELLSSSSASGQSLLPVNSRRWNEARVLSDCINIKICKLYLYMNDPTVALAQLNGHLHMFQSYSPSWGIGEQTFEYWACLSKQYRLFADMIDAAVQAGYKIPLPTEYLIDTNTPGSPLFGNTVISSSTGCNPGAILQHPGFYYHLAAMCCAERRRRFLEHEHSFEKQEDNALLLEKLVDHSSLTIELLTKSYEQFKRYRNGRMTLYLAAEIAGTYYETGKYDMAIKFFERIGKTYRKEKWSMVLTSILRWSLRCAKELASWEKAIECLVELMSDELPMTESKRNDIQRELLDMLAGNSQTAANIERSPLMIHMDQITSFLSCHVQIKNRTNFVGSHVNYQITLKTNKSSPPIPLRFSALKISFNDPQYNVVLTDADLQSDVKNIELINFSNDLNRITEEGDYFNWFTAKCDLRVIKGQTKVLQGLLIPQKCAELKITSISFDLPSRWQVELNYTVDQISESQITGRRKWLESVSELDGKPTFKVLDGRGVLYSTNIMQKPPSIDIVFDHNAPALLDELFKLDITIKNTELEAIKATLYAEIKNAEGIVKEDYITFIEGADNITKELGLDIIEAGQSITKTAYLHGASISGSRIVSLNVKYTVVGKDSSEIVEKTEAIRIPFAAPFDATFELCALTEKLEKSIALDLEKTEKWLLTASLKCFSAWDLEIESIRLDENKTFSHPYTSLSLLSKMEDLDISTWKTGHAYNASYLFRLNTTDLTEQQPVIPTGSIVIRWKRSGASNECCKTIISLPTIQLQQQGLSIIADVPSEIYLGEPFTLSYTIYNPTEHITEYTASIELSEAFVFSGYKQVKGSVLPLSRKMYHYTCYPLLAGKVKLPKLKVVASQQHHGEKEIPVEMVGTGTTFTLNNDLQPRQASPSDNIQQPILAFVHAKRKF